MGKRIALSLVILLSCICIVRSQDSLVVNRKSFPKIIYTVSPISFFNIRVPSVKFGVEYPIAERKTLRHELGYVYWRGEQLREKKGFRHESEFRFYLNNVKKENDFDYFGIQFRYWQFKSPTVSTFFRGGGQYRQRVIYTIKQSAIGLGVSYGSNVIKKGKMTYDVGISAGAQYFRHQPQGIPDDAEDIGEGGLFAINRANENDYVQPYVAVIFKLGITRF